VDTWYRSPANPLLRMASLPFACVAALRRAGYRSGLLHSVRLPVPVVVVGNIGVGGTGKTPLVLWLAQRLLAAGRRPGIVSRGYGGSATIVSEVLPDSDPEKVGDEPLLLARRSGVPVFVGRDRVAAGRALLERYPECDTIVADDGLQHYRLARDVEIVVVDAARGFGNGSLLPAGPLREPPARLASVDAIVLHGDGTVAAVARHAAAVPRVRMRLRVAGVRRLREGSVTAPLASLSGRPWNAVAGIGNPARFFALLRQAGLAIHEHAFADHHAYRAADLAFDSRDGILMTEKDAVKCEQFAGDDAWAVVVEAELDADLAGIVLARLERSNAAETA